MNAQLEKDEIAEQIGLMSEIINKAVKIKGNVAFKQGILHRALLLRQELREQFNEEAHNERTTDQK